MSDLTPAQVLAYQQLETAIDRVGRLQGYLEDGEVLTTFAVIAACESIERPGATRYLPVYPRGSLPAHVIAGLFTVALDITNGGWHSVDGDDV